MTFRRWIPAVAVIALAWTGRAAADEVEIPPDQVTTGEVRVTMSSDYARLRVDGEEWENHEFLDNGRTVLIQGLDRTGEHVVSLTPIYPDLEPVEIKVAPADWKLTTLAKRLKVWRVELKVVFKKAAPPMPAAPPVPEPAPEPEPEPEPAPAQDAPVQ